MSRASTANHKQRLPILQGVLPLASGDLVAGLVAGVTLAALAIPEVMGYTKIAGMPVVTGLYTILVPLAVFALLGSSRHLVVGADSATAAVMAAGLAGLAAQGTPAYVELAAMLAILTGLFLLVARVVRLGFLADFLSRTVLVGFLTGVGVQVALGQIPGMLGVPQVGRGPLAQALVALEEIPRANLATVAVSAAVLVVIVGTRLVNRRIPGALLAVIGAIVASWALDLAGHGVLTLGPVPSGLPRVSFPSVTPTDLGALALTAFSLFLIVVAQSAATSRAYAAKYAEEFDEGTDLVGLALANLSAGMTGTFVVNGSPTKTEMVDSAGGRNQIAQLTTAAIVLLVLLFLTKPLSYLPSAVLSAVVFLIGVELVDVVGMRSIFSQVRAEFWVAFLTAATVVIVGVEQGIALAIVLSIVIHLSHSYRPYDGLLVLEDDGHWHHRAVDSDAQIAPGVAIYRFGASLYYANSGRFEDEIQLIVSNADPPLHTLILVAEAIGDVDYTGAEALRSVHGQLAEQGITFLVAELQKNVRDEFARLGLTDLLGVESMHRSLRDAVRAANPEPIKAAAIERAATDMRNQENQDA